MKLTKTKSKLFTDTEHKELFDYRLKGKKKNYAVYYRTLKPKLQEFIKVADKYLEKFKELLKDEKGG